MSEDASASKRVWGWVLYDFAESTFATSILVAVLPIYFLSIAPEGDITFSIAGFSFRTAAPSIWGYTVALSTIIVAAISPILGAVADYSGTRKRFLAAFGYLGALFSGLLFLVGDGQYLLAAVLFMVANIGSAAGTVFYNALLPEVAAPEDMDWVSGKGFSMGYLGGGILLVVNMLMIGNWEWFGFSSQQWAVRTCFLTVGVWWAVFATPTMLWVDETRRVRGPTDRVSYFSLGFRRIFRTLRELRNYRDLLVFLVAFLIFNDGIQTVIVMATPYGKAVLNLDEGALLGTLVMIQAIGIPGSLLFGRLAKAWNAKSTVMATLAVWMGIVVYAWQMESATEFWVLGGLVGLVLGGSQAISRSLYAAMIPKAQAAEFYGFLSFSSRFASFLGPLAFAVARDVTGSMRTGILVLIAFFGVGLALLALVDVRRGVALARQADQAAGGPGELSAEPRDLEHP